MDATIEVSQLSRHFRAPVRPEGLRAAIRSLTHREYREIPAVREVSFRVGAGEIVGFLGPNGAGKTTTLKILSGILHPTAGEATVLSFTPWKREPAFLKQIAMVRGSKAMGGPGELTVHDSLRFQQLVYEIPDATFRANLAELVEMLDLGRILERQVRALSLGERMRAGLAMALIYRPRVLFLDEPTIGLDASAVGLVRAFVGEYTHHTGATVILTSHAMADVEELCRRVILIDGGTIRHDGDLQALKETLTPFKDVHIQLAGESASDWKRYGQIVRQAEGQVHLRIARDRVPDVTGAILREDRVVDLSVTEPPLESVMRQVYAPKGEAA
ncbi:MAG: ATP-binding cassette domain-containing protein [Thermomicrobiales bacterium]